MPIIIQQITKRRKNSKKRVKNLTKQSSKQIGSFNKCNKFENSSKKR